MTDEYEDADLNINWDDVGVTFFYGAGRWLTGPSKKDLGNHSGEETLRDYRSFMAFGMPTHRPAIRTESR